MTLDRLMQEAAAAFGVGDGVRAEPLFRQIVDLNPRDAKAWYALAHIAAHDGRVEEACELAMRAHRLDRRNPLYLSMLGASCMESGRSQESLGWFQRALKEKPECAENHYNLASALHKLGQYGPAEHAYRRALKIEPSMGDAANNLASLCMRAGRFEEARELLDRARRLLPDAEILTVSFARVVLALRGADAAIEHLQTFLERHPDAAHVHLSLALRLLAEGRFAEGWHEYQWRLRIPGSLPPPGSARTLASDLRGNTVLLAPEQGLGDQLFFLRFAPLVRERGAKIFFDCPGKIAPLLEGAPALDGIFRAGSGAPSRPGDAIVASVADLPWLLRTAEVAPPFPIAIAPERISAWHSRLAALGPPPYLGMTWRGGTAFDAASGFGAAGVAAIYKEVGFEPLGHALRVWPGTLVVLQRSPMSGEVRAFSRAAGRAAHDLSGLNEQLDDMAAVLALIDEYVGVSNTNMHIRAGVGKTARVLVPFPPEFRWMHAGETSPWFPGFSLYRQPASLDWTVALDALSRDVAGAPSARSCAGTAG